MDDGAAVALEQGLMTADPSARTGKTVVAASVEAVEDGTVEELLRLELGRPYVALGFFQKPRVLSLPRCVRFAGPVSAPVRSVSLS